MPDFFISYTGSDERWAEWIGWTLEAVGFSVVIQKWDFTPGSNFVLNMHRAAAGCERTIVVLSSEYLKSAYAAPEWAAAFVSDPEGSTRKLVPVRVVECKPAGLLKAIVYIDLAGSEEETARQVLLEGVAARRAKPSSKPDFPGKKPGSAAPAFPGSPRAAVPGERPLLATCRKFEVIHLTSKSDAFSRARSRSFSVNSTSASANWRAKTLVSRLI